MAKKEFACNGTVVEHPEYGEVKPNTIAHSCPTDLGAILNLRISGGAAAGGPERENLPNAGEYLFSKNISPPFSTFHFFSRSSVAL